ncbi:hypothetical protein, partial [Syntrophomonas palmitatica]|uniref:hypothetical protein n=1 Tax=Syntrophomonas palmitatica TaxID=402877 RepID=UPI0012ECF8BE
MGSSLQTHSSVIIYIAIVSVYVARPAFRSYTGLNLKWYWLSAVLFLLGYANMIYFNLTSHGGSIRWLSNKGYALEQHLSLSSYLTNVLNMITQILRSLGSNYGSHEHLWQYLNHPTFLLAVLLLVFGISLAAKKGSPALLPVWIIAGTLIIMPLVNKRFVFYLATRYTMPVLICCMLLAGQAAAHIFRQMPQYLGDRKYLAPLSLSLVVLLAACQFIPYSYYCISHLGSNESNRMTLQALNLACEMARYDKRLILLDKSLPIENQPLPYLMSLVSQPYREV